MTDEGKGEDNIWHRNIIEYFNLQKKLNNAYDFCEAYGLTEEDVEEFMVGRGVEIFWEVPPRPKCREVLRRLKEGGYKIILVTAREFKENEITLKWLKEHKIPFHKLVHSHQKAEICIKEGIKFFIDDHQEHLIPMRDLDIGLLLMDMDHNFHYKGDIKRVYNWEEIEREINSSFEG